jgi:hypothetical protein
MSQLWTHQRLRWWPVLLLLLLAPLLLAAAAPAVPKRGFATCGFIEPDEPPRHESSQTDCWQTAALPVSALGYGPLPPAATARPARATTWTQLADALSSASARGVAVEVQLSGTLTATRPLLLQGRHRVTLRGPATVRCAQQQEEKDEEGQSPSSSPTALSSAFNISGCVGVLVCCCVPSVLALPVYASSVALL